MRLKFILSLSFILLLVQLSFSQKDSLKYSFSDNLYVSGQYGGGFLIAHRSSLEPLVNTYTHSFLLEIGKTSYGKKSWEQLYNYPTLGLGYYHGNLGNDDIFGTTNALYGFIEAPYFPEKKVAFGYKFGFGLAYLSEKFDIDKNIYNVAIGSHINFFIHFSFDGKLNLLQDRLFIKTGLGFSHMSNGKTQTPNLGLNILDWHLSMGYYLGQRIPHYSSNFPKPSKHLFMFIVAGGFKEFTEANLGKYFAGNTTIEYEYSVGNKINWGLGSDIFYDGVVHEELIQKNDTKASQHATRVGLHASYTIYYHKVGFIIQMGSYIAPYYTDDGYIYHRVGFRVKISKNLLANLTMKTHWGRADIVEFGLGYYFTKK